MKGSPILRAVFMILPLLFLAWPLASVTASRGHVSNENRSPNQPEKREYRADLSLKSTHPFTEVIFTAGDQKSVWKNGEGDKELILPISDGEILCSLEVTWQGNPEQAALSLEIVPDFLEEKKMTLWSEDSKNASTNQLLQWPEAKGGGDE